MQLGESTVQTSAHQSAHGIIVTLLNGVMLSMGMVVMAWVLLWVGFGLHQVCHGVDQTHAKIEAILKTNRVFLEQNLFFTTAHLGVVSIEQEKDIAHTLLVKIHWLAGWQTLHQEMEAMGDGLKTSGQQKIIEKTPGVFFSLQNNWHRIFYPWLSIFWDVTQVVITRLFIFLLALPVFLLWIGLGMVDGLVQRDIRKFQAARESTFLFHRIKKVGRPCFFMPLFLYFVWPWPVSPTLFFIPVAIVLGWMVQISLHFFKKYL